jgi:murein tripeptide amidase MpaA
MTARIHPSETCSSFIITSFINEILTNPEYDDFLRQNTLKIIPMVNPDGVIFGNFRTSTFIYI